MDEIFNQLCDLIKKNKVRIIDFKVTDLTGVWHHLSIPVERLIKNILVPSSYSKDILEKGIGFDGSSYGFLSVEKSDMVFIPDAKSAFLNPIPDIPTVSMIGDIYKIGSNGLERFADDPRFIAEKAELFLSETGISDKCLFGPEFEFYILDNIEFAVEKNHIGVYLDSEQAEWNACNSMYAKPGGNQGYKVLAHKGYHADLPYDASFNLRNKMALILEENGIPVKYHHSENGGPGQVELEIEFSTLRDISDRTQKLKYLVKNTAVQNGKTVTFMPKPFFGEAGSGMHVHLHMFKKGKPLFFDKNGYSALSEKALFAIGGILKHSAALMAFTNPSANSYKRLVPGYEAPVSICFAEANRSAVIRIPAYAKEPENKRFEFRPSDATANPYLCFSAILMAAIDGILNKIDPTAEGFGPWDKNMYHLTEKEKKHVKTLPKSLDEAADAVGKDHAFLLAGSVFTESIINSQIKKLKRDVEEISQIPHPVEFKKYFDL
ncbi:MAG: type I glutamate--ammonia ligase [Treponema sp.]|nr:type I glutamate--ammonia ligase [Treponema sp.]